MDAHTSLPRPPARLAWLYADVVASTKRRRLYGAAEWLRMALVSSALPFAALLVRLPFLLPAAPIRPPVFPSLTSPSMLPLGRTVRLPPSAPERLPYRRPDIASGLMRPRGPTSRPVEADLIVLSCPRLTKKI